MKNILGIAQGSACSFLIALLACVAMSGCSGGGAGGLVSGSPSGRLQVLLTDAPAPLAYAGVHLRIDKVVVVPQGLEGAADDDPGLLDVPMPGGSMDVDIMQLHFVQQLLGTALIPPGSYNQIRLILAANPPSAPFNNYLVLTGSSEQIPLTTPSAQKTGVKINGSFTVTPGVLNTILLDFNPKTAIVERGHSGQFNLKPTGIILTQIYSSLANAASISGVVRSPVFNSYSSAIVSIVPRNPAASSAITSGVVFGNFSGLGVWKAPFTAYVPPNSSANMPSANYKVFVQAFKDTKQSSPIFQLFSSSLMNVTTAGQDYLVPPDPNGVITLQP